MKETKKQKLGKFRMKKKRKMIIWERRKNIFAEKCNREESKTNHVERKVTSNMERE
jgi:hypothetical protein